MPLGEHLKSEGPIQMNPTPNSSFGPLPQLPGGKIVAVPTLTSLLQWDDLVQCLLALTIECERRMAFQNVYLEMFYPLTPPASHGCDIADQETR